MRGVAGDNPTRGEGAKTVAQCTAKTKNTGERCKGQAVKGYPVCRMHGAGSQGRDGRAGGR